MAGAMARLAPLMASLHELGLELRGVDAHEWPSYAEAVYRGFHAEPLEAHLQLWREVADPDRTFAVFDGGDVVGTTESMRWTVAVPWADPVTCAAVTSVTVAPTHRRRGLLRAMMHHQLAQFHRAGEPLAALYASEAPIYPRFGFGMAAGSQRTVVRREHAVLRPEVGDAGPVRFVGLDTAAADFPAVLARALRGRPGFTPRPAGLWRAATVFDPAEWRDGFSPRRAVAVGDGRGYALYRTSSGDGAAPGGGIVRVEELVATDPRAEASLWRFVLGLDLMDRIEAANRPVDDALRFMLADPGREIRTVSGDLYLRIVDVPTALAARGYAVDGALTLEVTDPVCPWNAGAWRLETRRGSTRCVRAGADTAADVHVAASELASLYLGGVGATRLHAAGVLHVATPDVLPRVDALFAAPRPPWNPTAF